MGKGFTAFRVVVKSRFLLGFLAQDCGGVSHDVYVGYAFGGPEI
jgi:hypothetical protein